MIRMRKAQMSLEMIIGMLILLVVAVVVIRIFLSNIMGIEKPKEQIGQTLRAREFRSKCEGLCNDFLASGSRALLAQFCYTKLTGDTDLNRNGKVDSFMADTKLLPICEDGIYCFHVFSCRTESGEIGWEDCTDTLCSAYFDVFGTKEKANEKVKELFPNAGSCRLPDNENWWKLYFGNDPCGVGTTTTPPPAISLSCVQQGTDLSCSWSGCVINAGSEGLLRVTTDLNTTLNTNSPTNYVFTNPPLVTGQSYTIWLVCDNGYDNTQITWS